MSFISKRIVPRDDELGLGNTHAIQVGSRRQHSLQWQRRAIIGLVAASLALYLFTGDAFLATNLQFKSTRLPSPEILARCRSLNVIPGPPEDFNNRQESDRFVPGTEPTLIKNATIWTGNTNGEEVVTGDVLLDYGLIKCIHTDSSQAPCPVGDDTSVIDAEGAWLTPGIVDVHSHIAVASSPELDGAYDVNSAKEPAQPWLRSLDGLNTHDVSYELAIAGGLTTSLILPGSADAIGGQAFTIKLRPTAERTPTSLLLEPPYGLNGSGVDYTKKPRWRHMKHACGENPSGVFHQTRMDTAWQLRSAYNQARKIREAQDDFCEKALNGEIDENAKFPEDLQWEAAIDILRGKVKVHTHCYEEVDLDNFVRLSNEFKFPVAAFHHAPEAYLVPELLKSAYGDVPPASAMFASFSRYKREAYRHSVFAPRILHDAGLRVVMKSDHAAIVSRYLLHEAQQAHYYGLPPNIALASVTTTAAGVLGLDHRIGYIKEGYDADVVIWDSHPLQIGATPKQVFIDGIAQFKSPFVVEKPDDLQQVPETPNFDEEVKQTIEYGGLPPLLPVDPLKESVVVFKNVSSVWDTDSASGQIQEQRVEEAALVVAQAGRIICTESCASFLSADNVTVFDLEGGSINPGLVSFGSDLGLQEIGLEQSTVDGTVIDPLRSGMPGILGQNPVIRTVDGLKFATRNALLAYRAGVTSAITAPSSDGFLAGLSAHFSTGAPLKTSPDAVIKADTALHFTIASVGQPSVSTQIAALRRLLLVEQEGDLGVSIGKVLQGEIPLVINVHSADHIATLLQLKKDVESTTGSSLRVTITGASEAHLLAKELGEADIGVILDPVRPFPAFWDQLRILPGPPLTEESALMRLMRNNVTVGFGVASGNLPYVVSGWAAHNTPFDIQWASVEAGGTISKADALAVVSTNVEKLLGADVSTPRKRDLVVTKGGDLLDSGAKVVGVISPRRGQVDLF